MRIDILTEALSKEDVDYFKSNGSIKYDPIKYPGSLHIDSPSKRVNLKIYEAYDDFFGVGEDRKFFKYEPLIKTNITSDVQNKVSEYLSANGYSFDYANGTASRVITNSRGTKTQDTTIGRALMKSGADDLANAYAKDSINQLPTMQVCISRNLTDIISMSTDRAWDSCLNLRNGMYSYRVVDSVNEGWLIAYLVKEGDLEIKSPLARVNILRYTRHNEDGNEIYSNDYILRVSNSVYRSKNIQMLDNKHLIEFVSTIVESIPQSDVSGLYCSNGYTDANDRKVKISNTIEGNMTEIKSALIARKDKILDKFSNAELAVIATHIKPYDIPHLSEYAIDKLGFYAIFSNFDKREVTHMLRGDVSGEAIIEAHPEVLKYVDQDSVGYIIRTNKEAFIKATTKDIGKGEFNDPTWFRYVPDSVFDVVIKLMEPAILAVVRDNPDWINSFKGDRFEKVSNMIKSSEESSYLQEGRLSILSEATKLTKSTINLSVDANVISREHSSTSEFNADISREYISGLNVEKVKEVVGTKYPFIVTFFDSILNREYKEALSVVYPTASLLVGKFSAKSEIVSELTPVLSLSSKYFESIDRFLAFYRSIEGEGSIVLKKVQAIYDRFKDSGSSIFKAIFSAYEEYLSTLNDWKETAKSKEVKQKIYSIFVKQQSTIESVLDEMASISPNKLDKSPYESISNLNIDSLTKYFEENRSEVKKIATKLLYIAFLDITLDSEIGSYYNARSYSAFSPAKDLDKIEAAIRKAISKKYPGEISLKITNKGFSLSIKSINSNELERLTKVLNEFGNVTYNLTILEAFGNIKTLPEYAFYYVYDEVFGTHKFVEEVTRMMDLDSPRTVASILTNQPMPEVFELGKFNFEASGNSIKVDPISSENVDKLSKYLTFFGLLSEFEYDSYAKEVTKLVNKTHRAPDSVLSTEHLLRSLRVSRGTTLNNVTLALLKNAIRNPETSSDAKYVMIYIAYHAALSGRDLPSAFYRIFKKIVADNQEYVMDSMIRKTKGDENKINKVSEFIMEFSDVLNKETLNRLKNHD